MKILAIESSAGPASAALGEDGRLLAYTFQNSGLTHSATLMAMVESMLKNAAVSIGEVDIIAAAVGPGSFTGVRIGVSAAKGLAWGADRPCIAVSALEAMAYAVPVDGLVCAVMDARRDQVYNALFSREGGAVRRLCPDRAVSLKALCEELQNTGKSVLLVGDGAQICYNFLKDREIQSNILPEPFRYQSAAGVVLAAFARPDQTCAAQELNPVYLRLPQAERQRLKKILSDGSQ